MDPAPRPHRSPVPAFALWIAVLLIHVALTADAAEFTPDQLEFFERKIRPVLVDRCYSCHSASAKKLKGDLHLDSRAAHLKGGESGKPSIVPGAPDLSPLIEAIRYTNQDLQMPPKGKLPPESIADFVEWVKMGAPWPAETLQANTAKKDDFDLEKRKQNHWAWRPIQRPTQPAANKTEWPRQPLDWFVLHQLESNGLKPAPPTSKALLLRRLHFDLTGFPPEPKDYAAFEADTSPTAVEKVVDGLLASPRFGERWARHWLDLVRYAETLAHEFDFTRHNAWRYRDYVIRAFNADVPYNQFVREHISGDLLEHPRLHPEDGSNESIIGTGFYWFGQQTHSPVDVRMHQAEFVDNQIDVLSKTFLGVTVACARCHDHKFDAISTRDFYSLYGTLTSSRYTQRAIDPPALLEPSLRQLSSLKPQLQPALAKAWIESAHQLASRLQQAPTNPATKRLRDSFPLTAPTPTTVPKSTSLPPSGIATSFATGLPADWLTEGAAFEQALVQPGDVIVGLADHKSAARLVTEPGLHSAKLARRLQGTLRSPTQVISNKFLHVRCSGRDSRFNVVIANFTIIQAPIYGDLRKLVDHDEPRWITIPVDRWQGLRLYLEFADATTGDPGGGGRGSYNPNGWIAVHQVAWSDDGQPPQSNPPASPPSTEDFARWTERLQEAALAALNSWHGPAESNSASTLANTRLIDALLANEWLPVQLPQDADAHLKEYQTIAAKLPEPRLVPAMAEGTPLDETVFIRGSPRTPGELVPRRFLEALGGIEKGPYRQGSGRAELAEYLLDPANPLTTRVIVNRVWLHLFGRGIVPTPDDFGVLGQPPSHPELLDYLADWFRTEGGWSIKKLVRSLATSQTYALSSVDTDPTASEKDPENIFLHRAHVRRLEGEIIRDSLLKLSGTRSHHVRPFHPHSSHRLHGRTRPPRTEWPLGRCRTPQCLSGGSQQFPVPHDAHVRHARAFHDRGTAHLIQCASPIPHPHERSVCPGAGAFVGRTHPGTGSPLGRLGARGRSLPNRFRTTTHARGTRSGCGIFEITGPRADGEYGAGDDTREALDRPLPCLAECEGVHLHLLTTT